MYAVEQAKCTARQSENPVMLRFMQTHAMSDLHCRAGSSVTARQSENPDTEVVLRFMQTHAMSDVRSRAGSSVTARQSENPDTEVLLRFMQTHAMSDVRSRTGSTEKHAKGEYGESHAANKHIEGTEEYQLFCAEWRGNQLINSVQTETNNERRVLGVQCGSGDDLLPNGNMASLKRPTNISK
ncbi:hypothetical protein J6590_075165 [Homalodisca vitripennis]|nr:hypothetical protein J6590_075165 [Homalodisca vitripennis]